MSNKDATLDDLGAWIISNSPPDLEIRLRMVIAFARDEETQPKDRYVQAILALFIEQAKEVDRLAETRGLKYAHNLEWMNDKDGSLAKLGNRIAELSKQEGV